MATFRIASTPSDFEVEVAGEVGVLRLFLAVPEGPGWWVTVQNGLVFMFSSISLFWGSLSFPATVWASQL